MKKIISTMLTLLLVTFYGQQALAELTIEITQGVDSAVSVAVVPFGGSSPEDVSNIVNSDLKRTGQFDPFDPNNMLSMPHTETDVVFADWRKSDVEYLVVGNINSAGGRYEASFSILDVVRQQSLAAGKIASTNVRKLAHRISDQVYEKITGIRGAFDTKIMYVTAERLGGQRSRYQLNYADADGYNARAIYTSSEPILSPTWSPDNKKVAFVSFKGGRPGIYIQDLATGKQRRITNYKGLNSSPAWSPDGRQLAVVLSKGGNPDIYLVDVNSGALRQITKHFGIDTEPSWMPDGSAIVFTSNRGGSPQIYKSTLATGKAERLTHEGRYNARARVFPDGKQIAMVHKGQGVAQFNIAVLELETGRMRLLTSTSLDESPSVAPNGTMLLYGSMQGQRGVLSAVSADGAVKLNLPSKQGDVREPAWSNFTY
ncbi:Tol-Pal system beta propeller repeat protein TolB [Zooshikella sp. RANM57]|uniref:Tol-Pal system beta propeller repeat protein TolB n=1 Tax=Zooshikella sp. RANM57 TaxID=3425863 RepID=UPI003D6F03AB